MSRGPAAPGFGAKWDSLNPPLTPWVLDVVHKMGFERTTPVQAGTIPRAMKNQDCVVEAVTGSGKTLAFVIPTLERILRREERYKRGQIAAVVVAPTRELAQQIHDVFHHFISSIHPPPTDPSLPGPSTPPPAPAIPLPLLVTSGTTTPYDTFVADQSTIIIGTPGRLASFLLSPRGVSAVKVSELDTLILDEADRLLSAPDHRRDVERIMRHLPKQRRTHLFSATMTDAVEELVGLGLRNPVRIVVNLKDKKTGGELVERRTPTSLQNMYLVCRHAEKTLQLIRLLRRESTINEAAKFIVYFSTCAAVDYFYRVLSQLQDLKGFHLTSFHGDLPPKIRETALSTFVAHPSSHLSPAVLLCTDVAARGVDFEDVDVVIQYDMPTDPKTFSHRAGRTARAGRQGKAIALIGRGREEDYIEFLALRKMPLASHGYVGEDLSPGDPPTTSLDPSAERLMRDMRAIVKTERELADKGAKAFVSAIRAYTKHEASYIFRVADLDFHSMGIGYGLLRLPAMPEIREFGRKREAARVKRAQDAEARETEDAAIESLDWADEDINWDTFAYSSKQRESARLVAMAQKAQGHGDEKRDAERKKRKIQAEMREAWSEQKERKARKEDRRDKRDKRKAAEWAAKDHEAIGPVEEFRRARKAGRDGDGGDGYDDEEGDEEDGANGKAFDFEYKAMKKEVKEERAAKKGRKEKVTVGMFDDLD